jgi:hypothetical protein
MPQRSINRQAMCLTRRNTVKKNLFKFAYVTLAVGAMIVIGQGRASALNCWWQGYVCGQDCTTITVGGKVVGQKCIPVICLQYVCEGE